MLKIKAKTGLEPILKDLQSNTLTKLCYPAGYVAVLGKNSFELWESIIKAVLLKMNCLIYS